MGQPVRHEVSGGFWVGKRALDCDAGPQGEWKPFPSGVVKSSQGGTVSLKLIDAPVSTQYVRVLMTESSNISEQHLVPGKEQRWFPTGTPLKVPR